ncbi:MAG TPA: cytochrome P450, partial [Iamia sp.]|nr:cytochrome P450 [Iamia sp.]
AVADAASRPEDFSSNMRCLLHRDDDGTPRRLSFGEIGVQTLATADAPLHALHRGIVFPEFVEKRMTALEPDIADVAVDGVDRLVGAGGGDFMAEVGDIVPFTIINRLIGFRNADTRMLKQAAFDSTELLSATLPLARLEALIDGVGPIQEWIAEQLALVADDPGDDILGSVARGVDSGDLGAYEAGIILHTLLSAGGESTTSLLGNAVRILAEQPGVQAELRRDPDQIGPFVEEVLRLEPPFRQFLRSVPRPTTLAGVEIPAGSTVMLFFAAANRDAAKFRRPDDIDLDRRPLRNHMGFGRGMHHCVGAPLARQEALTVLTVLLDRTTSFTLDPTSPPRWVQSLLVRRNQQVPIRVAA